MKIKVCPGIGDNVWLFQKLLNQEQRFDFLLPDGKPQRGHQVFELLPQITRSAGYEFGLKSAFVEANNAEILFPHWEDIVRQAPTERFQDSICLSANKHLEAGKRIEDFLPDLPTSFRIAWDTGGLATWQEVADYFPGDKEYIGIYTSSYATTRAWAGWQEKEWFTLIGQLYRHNPQYVFTLIGAKWDSDLLTDLREMLDKAKIPYVLVLDQPFNRVLEIMKRLKYLYSFPSGIGIVAPTIGCPVMMYYPNHLEAMINAWAAPEDLESGLYRGVLFPSPEEAFDWALDHRKI